MYSPPRRPNQRQQLQPLNALLAPIPRKTYARNSTSSILNNKKRTSSTTSNNTSNKRASSISYSQRQNSNFSASRDKRNLSDPGPSSRYAADDEEEEDMNENNKKNKRVRFGNNNNNNNLESAEEDFDEGGDVADNNNKQNKRDMSSTSRALISISNSTTTAFAYDPDPEIDTLVKRRLGQENSNKIRLTRTLHALEQDLIQARKEHSKLSSRANAIPMYREQLSVLRAECENLREDIESLDIEHGYYQQRYQEIDRKLDPVVAETVKNKKRLDAVVRENRVAQRNATVANLQKREKALKEEIQRLSEQRDRAILLEKQAAQEKENQDIQASPMRQREQELRKALDQVREQHAIKRNSTLHNLQAQLHQELKQLAEEEVIREAQQTRRIGDFTNQLNKAELDNTSKKGEVTELTSRHAHAVARLQELNADLAIEQQRLVQSQTALAPAQEELASLQKLIASAKEHLDQHAFESQVKKNETEKSANAAAHAWEIELAELEKTCTALESKVESLRKDSVNTSKELEDKRKEKSDLETNQRKEVATLVQEKQTRIAECKAKSDKTQEEINKVNAASEKVEQEAVQIEQKLGASQKAEIIMQLQRQQSELQGQIDSLFKGNNKLEEKLKGLLAKLGDDVLL